MSRLATLPNALRVELIERVRGIDGNEQETTSSLEGGAHIDVSQAQAIYARERSVVVQMDRWQWYRFTMPSEQDACAAVRTLASIGSRT